MTDFLAAYTESSRSYPPYVNISAEDSAVTFTVRGKQASDGSCGETASMPIPRREAEKLLKDALTALKGNQS